MFLVWCDVMRVESINNRYCKPFFNRFFVVFADLGVPFGPGTPLEAFVRFEHTTDDIYFARVEPDFNVLPLIGEHFRQRYQDQHWAIYDITRGYGIYYDKSNSTATRPAALQTITDLDDAVLRRPASIHSADERRYQQFWQGYFTNVNITERKNPRLHRQYLPQRYWKYLSEKQILPNAEHIQKRR